MLPRIWKSSPRSSLSGLQTSGNSKRHPSRSSQNSRIADSADATRDQFSDDRNIHGRREHAEESDERNHEDLQPQAFIAKQEKSASGTSDESERNGQPVKRFSATHVGFSLEKNCLDETGRGVMKSRGWRVILRVEFNQDLLCHGTSRE